MRLNKLFILYSLFGILMASCIKDEAPNAEADITGISFEEDVLANSYIDLNPSYDESQNAYPIRISVKEGTDMTSLTPIFELTPGATISPASGSVQNFTTPVRYTVTSEDKAWHRVYAITAREQKASNIPTTYHFEKVRIMQNVWQEFYEEQDSGNELTWASGNKGFKWAMSGAATEDYPTTQIDNGKTGKCVKLETRLTGDLGNMVGMPIAAGNLFIGNFDVSKALAGQEGALKATTFGFQFYKHPKTLKGYYKYKAGPVYTENGQPQSGLKDRFDIYAIMYEADDNSFMLDGTNAKTSDKLVYLAQIKADEALETDQWTEFSLPFERQNNKSIDEQKLQNGKYKLGIIFSSSVEGDHFKGAVGSTLYIDEVELVCEEN
jgi:hypothetical protein